MYSVNDLIPNDVSTPMVSISMGIAGILLFGSNIWREPKSNYLLI